MIREVVGRRFRKGNREARPVPDIFLIDGGQGHLKTAAEVIDRKLKKGKEIRFPQERPVVLSLAKREETLFRWGAPGPVPVERSHPALRLLMYVRDEAHRFAQHYHHILRAKKTFER